MPFGEEGRRRGSRRFAILGVDWEGAGIGGGVSRGVSEVHKRQEVETETKGPLLGVFGVLKFVAVTHLLIASLGDCSNFAGRQRELIPYRSLGPWLLGGHSHLRRVFAFFFSCPFSLSCVVGD